MDFLAWLLIAALAGVLGGIGTFFTDILTALFEALGPLVG